jgi:hypothetical protein
MKQSTWRVIVLAAGLASLPHAHGQQATERFIPLGQSPGLSDGQTLIGPIEAMDPHGRTVTLATEQGSTTAVVTERTRIWLDRTPLGLSNLRGNLADIVPGRRMEVRLATPSPRGAEREADWVKVELGER